MSNVNNILLAGVGGQGIILAGKLLAEVLAAGGFDVKLSEVHGMAQRGGSVVTQVRFGPRVYSPLVSPGKVDYLVAFEQIEAWRWISWLRSGGLLIMDEQIIYPAGKTQVSLPEDLTSRPGTICLNARQLARQAGLVKAANMVLLGALAAHLGLDLKIWHRVLEDLVPAKYLEPNRKALEEGFARAKPSHDSLSSGPPC
ncbi:MAG: indolepyruvate oxidoreductase subunit beta [Limnochordia bacterium]|jgi:indolepyruvate ferredoxin oxidoreductase beta subunit